MIKAVIFDLDGTLANTLNDLADATNFAISHFDVPAHETEEYKYFVGNGVVKLIERALPEDKRTPEIIAAAKLKFFEYYNLHYMDKTCAYAGIPEMLGALAEKGIKMAVVTNKPEPNAIEVVNKLFGNVFSFVCGQKEGIPTKPDPTLTLMVLEKLGVKPEQALFVGDSGVDMAVGVNSGTIPVGVLWGFRAADELLEHGAKHLIENPYELIELAEKF